MTKGGALPIQKRGEDQPAPGFQKGNEIREEAAVQEFRPIYSKKWSRVPQIRHDRKKGDWDSDLSKPNETIHPRVLSPPQTSNPWILGYGHSGKKRVYFESISRGWRGIKRVLYHMIKGKTIRALKGGMFLLIQLYQHTFSIFFGPCCRFTPSCSSYAALSIERFGIIEGTRLAIKRFIRCHPFHPGGYDPVPENPAIHSSVN